MASRAGQWGRMVRDTPRVENSVSTECPLPTKAACSLRQHPTGSEADSRDGLAGEGVRQLAAQVTAWLSRLRMERGRVAQALHHPYSCLPGSAPLSPPSKAGQAARTGTRGQGRAASHSLSFEHSVTWTHAWAVRPVTSFLINTVLIESLFCSKPCQASLL